MNVTVTATVTVTVTATVSVTVTATVTVTVIATVSVTVTATVTVTVIATVSVTVIATVSVTVTATVTVLSYQDHFPLPFPGKKLLPLLHSRVTALGITPISSYFCLCCYWQIHRTFAVCPGSSRRILWAMLSIIGCSMASSVLLRATHFMVLVKTTDAFGYLVPMYPCTCPTCSVTPNAATISRFMCSRY